MTVALVGNGPVQTKCADEVEAHDVVVRMNTAANRPDTGGRTDVMVIVNTGKPGWLGAFRDGYLPPDAIALASEMWLTKHPDIIYEAIGRGGDPHDTWCDHSAELIGRRLAGKRWSFIPADMYRGVVRALAGVNADPGTEPSTGIVTLYNVMHVMRPKAVTLYGFTHEGWSGHSWRAERCLVGNLKPLVSYGGQGSTP